MAQERKKTEEKETKPEKAGSILDVIFYTLAFSLMATYVTFAYDKQAFITYSKVSVKW